MTVVSGSYRLATRNSQFGGVQSQRPNQSSYFYFSNLLLAGTRIYITWKGSFDLKIKIIKFTPPLRRNSYLRGRKYYWGKEDWVLACKCIWLKKHQPQKETLGSSLTDNNWSPPIRKATSTLILEVDKWKNLIDLSLPGLALSEAAKEENVLYVKSIPHDSANVYHKSIWFSYFYNFFCFSGFIKQILKWVNPIGF